MIKMIHKHDTHKILEEVPVTARRQSSVHSSLLPFPCLPVGNDNGEDWTKSCRLAVRIAFLMLLMGNVSREDWTKFRQASKDDKDDTNALKIINKMMHIRFWRKFRKQLVGKFWYKPLCSSFLGYCKEMTAERIGPNFADDLLPVLS